MKHGNLLAASLTAATFVALALLPLTKEALRFDMQMAAGRRVLSGALTDLGIKSAPPGGFAAVPEAASERNAVTSGEFSVRLADAMVLPGREKWDAMQRLVTEFPDHPAGHAALARIACKNGGSVDVGHPIEESAFDRRPSGPRKYTPSAYPQDAGIMLRSCVAGETLDPENAYFPAMAAIAHLAMNQDSAAHEALRRAADKPHWREYFEVEAQGRVRRAELRNGPQNSLTRTAHLASMLFPHYAALRGMARVVTAQAMYREQAGDIAAGLTLRRDVARIGETMGRQSSSLIGNLVGMAIIRVTTSRPGGIPLPDPETRNGDTRRLQGDARFRAYLAKNSTVDDVERWKGYEQDEAEAKEIIRQASYVSVFGTRTLFESQGSLVANLALLGAVCVLSLLGGFALLRPWRFGTAAQFLTVIGVAALFTWGMWNAVGSFRDIFAYGNLLQSLSGEATDSALARAEQAALIRSLLREGSLALAGLLVPTGYLLLVAVLAKRQRIPMGDLLQRWTLPLAAALTLVYGAHLTAYALREQTVRAELQQVITHEARYVAEKLGRAWPGDAR